MGKAAWNIQFNISVQDSQGRWTAVPGEYLSETEAMTVAHAVQFSMGVILGKFTPPVCVQRWERKTFNSEWQVVQWHSMRNGTWTPSMPQH